MTVVRSLSAALFLSAAAAAVGCSGYVDTTPATEVEVSGTVTGVDAKAFKDTYLLFFPTGGNGAVGTNMKLNPDGSFSGKMFAGTYAYYLGSPTENDRKAEASLKGVPEEVKKVSLDRTVKVSGGKIEIKF